MERYMKVEGLEIRRKKDWERERQMERGSREGRSSKAIDTTRTHIKRAANAEHIELQSERTKFSNKKNSFTYQYN